ncbi:MAG: DNA polymerase III subunit beta [Actinomycetota bacterium]|nr:MAG: DNA polymerase III subunit beta [Actinomycetota bacterium]
MKFRVERDVLADAVAWVARTLPSRPSMPMLAGLLLEVGDGPEPGLTLSTFDYEVSARVAIAAQVDDPGRTLVSGRLLADIARALPAAPVQVDLEGSRVSLRCGRAAFTLPTLPVEDYPSLPAMPSASGSVPGAVLAGAVAQVAIAAGRDDTLPTLTGIRVEIDGDLVTLAATDRYRLAVREFAWSPQTGGLQTAALVPARTLAETAKALAGADEVLLALSASGGGEGLMGFEGVSRRTTTRLLDGEFPKYRSLLPTESATVASVDTGPLVDAVKRVALVAERNTPVRLSFAADELVLRAGTGDEAQATEVLECQVEGDPIEISFNPQYLLDGLGAVEAPVTRLAFTSSARPAVLTGLAEAGGQVSTAYRYLLMPVRLTG